MNVVLLQDISQMYCKFWKPIKVRYLFTTRNKWQAKIKSKVNFFSLPSSASNICLPISYSPNTSPYRPHDRFSRSTHPRSLFPPILSCSFFVLQSKAHDGFKPSPTDQYWNPLILVPNQSLGTRSLCLLFHTRSHALSVRRLKGHSTCLGIRKPVLVHGRRTQSSVYLRLFLETYKRHDSTKLLYICIRT